MLKAIFAGVVTGLAFLAGYTLWYTGYFKPVVITDESIPSLTFIAKEHTGPYHKIVPVITEVENWAKEKGLGCRRSFGLYLDDPHRSEEPRLRSLGGCVIEDNEIARLPEIEKGLPVNFQLVPFAGGPTLVARFAGSPGIGPFKVYPAVQDALNQRGLKQRGWNVLEIYEVRGPTEMTTTYYFPLVAPGTDF